MFSSVRVAMVVASLHSNRLLTMSGRLVRNQKEWNRSEGMGEHGERKWGGDIRKTESDDTVMCVKMP